MDVVLGRERTQRSQVVKQSDVVVRIPIEAAQVYRFEAAHRSDMMPPTVPI
jgi:hypothetical protein